MSRRFIDVPSRRIGNDEITITKIHVGKKDISITLSDSLKLKLDQNTFSEFRLYVGKTLEASQLRKIKEYGELSKSYDYALKRLSKGSYTEHQIFEKLTEKGLTPSQSGKICYRLKSVGMIDDNAYAKSYMEDVARIKLLGKNRVKSDLRDKGVDEKIVSFLRFPDEEQAELARAYLSTLERRYQSLPPKGRMTKAKVALHNRGFDEWTISKVLGYLGEGDSSKQEERFDRLYESCLHRYSRKYQGYDLKQHVIAYLLRKGYEYEDITSKLEGEKL